MDSANEVSGDVTVVCFPQIYSRKYSTMFTPQQLGELLYNSLRESHEAIAKAVLNATFNIDCECECRDSTEDRFGALEVSILDQFDDVEEQKRLMQEVAAFCLNAVPSEPEAEPCFSKVTVYGNLVYSLSRGED